MNKAAANRKLAEITERDPRWAAVRARDPAADGQFYFSVRTTGVYCRPSCAARPARPENVRFYATRVEAEQAGFRPCQRCKPDQLAGAEQTMKIAEVCRLLEQAVEHTDAVPGLDELARRAGLSTAHFHRRFKAVTGLTPKAYAAAHRTRRIQAELAGPDSVTGAIYGAGYSSSSRFYETSNQILGMTPSTLRAGGANTTIHFALGECSLGAILVAQSARGICAILLGADPEALARDLQDQFPQANLVGGDAAFEQVVAQVVGFIEAPGTGLALPLDIRGTAFQQRVWQALKAIPLGTTASYTDIAARIGAPKAFRAVAQACGANALAVAIPCHRVVKQDGALSGYRWGVERKRALLDREAAG